MQYKLYLIIGLLIVPCISSSQILSYNNTNPSPEGGFFSFTPSSLLGTQQYKMDSTLTTNDSCYITSMNFVGGIDSAGSLTVTFQDTNGVEVSAWVFTLAAGAFNYNLTFPDVPIPLCGIIEVTSSTTVGQWYLNHPQSQIGTQDTSNAIQAGGSAVVYAMGLTCRGQELSCPEYRILNDLNITTGTYHAEKDIITISTALFGNQVSLVAGESVKLGSHFEIQSGAELMVDIGGCPQ